MEQHPNLDDTFSELTAPLEDADTEWLNRVIAAADDPQVRVIVDKWVLSRGKNYNKLEIAEAMSRYGLNVLDIYSVIPVSVWRQEDETYGE